MVEDPRSKTKQWLDNNLRNNQLTKDDDVTEVSFIVCYAGADYPLSRVFQTKGVDLLFLVDVPVSTPLLGHDRVPYGYQEKCPVETACIDKTEITGTNLMWKANAELRYVAETFPLGSQRSFDEERVNTYDVGTTKVYSQKLVLNYLRGTT